MVVRKPAVAGQFYESSAQKLKDQIKGLSLRAPEKIAATACLVPHAGYVYSGRVAVETISSIQIPERIILLGPNHTGYGESFALMSEGTWQTPLGKVDIDTGLAKKILSGSKYLKEDPLAHLYEHSLEVELPILQYFKSHLRIVPVAFMTDNILALKETGVEIATAIKEAGIKDSTLIVASSDMTHYQPHETAAAKDKEAIQAILELDEDKLVKKIHSLDITMCGWAPAVVMIAAAKSLGAEAGKLVRYETSGDITGDKASVVGYAGIIIA